ncbi:ABC transporter substrate-binding protein [Labrys wisconsinensis]|uniref:Multiple sugar transport system substrate-binding protein n=1 Tax=Labrys wisconsinensis TaxID=425677 RepID=A0ABU0JKC7_9HYPH|nr:extracellular solute-binding protein [Labrys wisconsinensis]MDQ0474728.1 multiple sugar transport system substrate-binding protein [Labrys wisconsinensis]
MSWKSGVGALLSTAALIGVLGAAAPAGAGEFDGVTVNVMTQTGAIQEPLQRRAPEFEKLTGAKINVIAVPFSDLYQKVLTDWASGTNSVDAAVFAPQWMVDYVAGGYLEEISGRIAKDTAIQWNDIAPFFRDFSSSYGGKTYLVPLDGDFHMLYYRTDVFEKAGLKPPATWDEYLADAKKLNGMEIDGTKIYGSCIAKKRNAQSYWFVTDVVGSMTQSKGTSQGTFFNTKDMTPLVDNEAFRKALDFLKESTQYGPPDELNLDVSDTRPLFTSGKCALNLDWGDVGVLAVDPATSKVIDKTGSVITPGSKEVLNWDTGKLEACTKDNCPHAIDGVNHAPYAAFGGWSGGINVKAADKVKDAAYAFFSYLGQPAQSSVDVTIGKTGFNPYRVSQLSYNDAWKTGGMSEKAAGYYLGAIRASLDSPNMILDLRIPQNQKYQQVVLDEAISRFLAGEIDKETTIKTIVAGWNDLNEQIGKDDQLKFYKSTLGIKD